jgi:hypothetical protein
VTQKGDTTNVFIPTMQNQIRAANEAFNNYLKFIGDKKFNESAKELEKLQQTLQTLSTQSNSGTEKKK